MKKGIGGTLKSIFWVL